ncbi:MAG: hypothetical protein J6T54_12490 [Fibrobacter sp.]|nr:hypothetical protein [Fibrobacter sp.]
MAKKTKGEQANVQAEAVETPCVEELLKELCDKVECLNNLATEQRDRINKLELKIDAVEKLSARRKNYTAEEIFKVQNPFCK